jgi:hypothetical protein
MSERTAEIKKPHERTTQRIARRLESAGWGLFFIWVGISLLMDTGWGVGLIGVAAIVLLGQVARHFFGLRLEPPWMVAGVIFLLAGTWELYRIEVDLIPILMILVGGALLLSMFRRRARTNWRAWCRDSKFRDASGRSCCSWRTNLR